jgi:hypothetical protein
MALWSSIEEMSCDGMVTICARYIYYRVRLVVQQEHLGQRQSTYSSSSSSSSEGGAGGIIGLLEDGLPRLTVCSSLCAASAASIHSEYTSMGSVRSVRIRWLEEHTGSRRHNRRTVNFALISLITYSADQLSETLFSVESDGDRLVVVTEQTSERRL